VTPIERGGPLFFIFKTYFLFLKLILKGPQFISNLPQHLPQNLPQHLPQHLPQNRGGRVKFKVPFPEN